MTEKCGTDGGLRENDPVIAMSGTFSSGSFHVKLKKLLIFSIALFTVSLAALIFVEIPFLIPSNVFFTPFVNESNPHACKSDVKKFTSPLRNPFKPPTTKLHNPENVVPTPDFHVCNP